MSRSKGFEVTGLWLLGSNSEIYHPVCNNSNRLYMCDCGRSWKISKSVGYRTICHYIPRLDIDKIKDSVLKINMLKLERS
jgi:hypothetical protein